MIDYYFLDYLVILNKCKFGLKWKMKDFESNIKDETWHEMNLWKIVMN